MRTIYDRSLKVNGPIILKSNSAEIDFIFEKENVLIPLEVKASENLQSKSLKTFADKYQEIHCYRTSLSDYRQESWMTNVPLYGVSGVG